MCQSGGERPKKNRAKLFVEWNKKVASKIKSANTLQFWSKDPNRERIEVPICPC